jgi:hypothetical protein
MVIVSEARIETPKATLIRGHWEVKRQFSSQLRLNDSRNPLALSKLRRNS